MTSITDYTVTGCPLGGLNGRYVAQHCYFVHTSGQYLLSTGGNYGWIIADIKKQALQFCRSGPSTTPSAPEMGWLNLPPYVLKESTGGVGSGEYVPAPNMRVLSNLAVQNRDMIRAVANLARLRILYAHDSGTALNTIQRLTLRFEIRTVEDNLMAVQIKYPVLFAEIMRKFEAEHADNSKG